MSQLEIPLTLSEEDILKDIIRNRGECATTINVTIEHGTHCMGCPMKAYCREVGKIPPNEKLDLAMSYLKGLKNE